MGPIDCPETSGRNYQYSLRNNPKSVVLSYFAAEASKHATARRAKISFIPVRQREITHELFVGVYLLKEENPDWYINITALYVNAHNYWTFFPEILSSGKHLQIMLTPTNDTEILSACNETNHTSRKIHLEALCDTAEPANQSARRAGMMFHPPGATSHFRRADN